MVRGALTVLEVVDDGRGPVRATRGIGLTGMADRVHALGGTFDAGAGEGGGFRVRVELRVPETPGVE